MDLLSKEKQAQPCILKEATERLGLLKIFNFYIHHFRINRSLAGWAHSQRRVGINITIPLH